MNSSSSSHRDPQLFTLPPLEISGGKERESYATADFWREQLQSFGGNAAPLVAGGFWREVTAILAGRRGGSQAGRSNEKYEEMRKPNPFKSSVQYWATGPSMHTNRFLWRNSIHLQTPFVLILGTGGTILGEKFRRIWTKLEFRLFSRCARCCNSTGGKRRRRETPGTTS